MIRTLLMVTILFGAGLVAQEGGGPVPQAPAKAPQLSERDLMVLTIMKQEVDIATLRLQKSIADLKKPEWHIDLVGGQWAYVPDAPEKPGPP